jgi:hypothetical protein
MEIRIGLVLLLLLCLSGAAAAEEGCPDGYIPVFQGGTQNRTCVVDYNLPHWQGQEQRQVQPAERWEDRWGAIARDSNATYGIVTGIETEELAKRLAVDECRRRGGTDCEWDFFFYNSCAAVVTGNRSVISHHDSTEKRRLTGVCKTAIARVMLVAMYTGPVAVFRPKRSNLLARRRTRYEESRLTSTPVAACCGGCFAVAGVVHCSHGRAWLSDGYILVFQRALVDVAWKQGAGQEFRVTVE